MPTRSPLGNMRNMSIMFMNCSHSLAKRETWIDCFLTSSLSIILVSSCDMHASSTVTLLVKKSSNDSVYIAQFEMHLTLQANKKAC